MYEDLYKKPVVAEADVLTYWNPTTLPVTPENCPEASSYISDGFDAIIHTKVSLDLTTLIKKIWPNHNVLRHNKLLSESR